MKYQCLVLTVVVIFVSGCEIVHHGKFSVLSNIDIGDEKYVLLEKNARGEDESTYWAFSAESPPKLSNALNDALKKYNGLFMRNVEVYREFWVIPLIWGEKKVIVEGEVWGKKEK